MVSLSITDENSALLSVANLAKFSNFPHYFSNFFFQKHLATNYDIYKIDLAILSNFW